jgi:hypothetical protein
MSVIVLARGALHHLLRDGHALVADQRVGAGEELLHLVLVLAAERAGQRFPDHAALSALLAEQLVVLPMRSNPDPVHATFNFNGKRSVVAADAHGPMATKLFEMKRWVPRISLQKPKILVR